MPSPGSCSRCRRALAADVAGELCPACCRAAVADPTGPPPRRAPVRLPANVYTDSTRSPGPDAGDFSPDPTRLRPEAPPGYDLVRCLGAGGMGTVYLAREHAAERTVAMKLLNAPSSRSAVERFLVEARALARLDHPNIIKVIAVELNWREPFLTMEYADGGSLADWCAPDALLPPAEAARLILGATDAVAAAHAAGILHRDLKPSNILLTTGLGNGTNGTRGTHASPESHSSHHPPTPKVSDFGLAKRTDRDDGLTRSGPIGTPRYMSPEAAAGRFQQIGPPADVYGLGATLYHLLTGQPPYTGDGPTEVIRRVIHDPLVRPRAHRPDLPAELEGIVVKAMEKEPGSRYPTATALAADLRRFLAGEAPTAPVLSPRRRAGRWLGRQRNRIAAAVGLVLLAGTLVAAGRYIWAGSRTVDPEQAIRAEIASGKVARLLKPDGRPRVGAWPLGQEQTDATPADDGTFAFGSSGHPRVVILLNDPGVDSYRLSAELLQAQKVGTGPDLSVSEVGLAFGYADQPGKGEARVHTLMVLRFADFDPADPPEARRVLHLVDYALITPHWLAPRNLFAKREVPGQNLDGPGPRWRPVSVDVTPAGVWVPGRNGPHLADAAGIALRRAGPPDPDHPDDNSLQDLVAAAVGPVELPRWHPRMPVGLWCHGSWAAARNVTIERLP